MTDEVLTAIGELRGFLAAFAAINGKADHNYTFTFDVMPRVDNPVEAVEAFFFPTNVRVVLTPVDDWRMTIRSALRRWLFEFRGETREQLLQTGIFFSVNFEDDREAILDWMTKRIETVGTDVRAWTAMLFDDPFCEAISDDLILEIDERIFLLHLGVCD